MECLRQTLKHQPLSGERGKIQALTWGTGDGSATRLREIRTLWITAIRYQFGTNLPLRLGDQGAKRGCPGIPFSEWLGPSSLEDKPNWLWKGLTLAGEENGELQRLRLIDDVQVRLYPEDLDKSRRLLRR